MAVAIRRAGSHDREAIWRIVEPIIRAGETYSLPRDMSKDEAMTHWFAPGRSVFVAEEGGEMLGTYYLRANRPGPGAHVANAGFMVSDKAGGQGVGQTMREHALATAKARGFAAMQSIPWSPPMTARFGSGSAWALQRSAAPRTPSSTPAWGWWMRW